MSMLTDFDKAVAHRLPLCSVARKFQEGGRRASVCSVTNDDVTMEPTQGEDSPDAKISSSSKEASGNKEATTASDSSEDDGSNDKDCVTRTMLVRLLTMTTVSPLS